MTGADGTTDGTRDGLHCPDRRHATGRVRLLRVTVAAGVSTCFRGLVFRILLLATRLGQRRRRERSLLAGKN